MKKNIIVTGASRGIGREIVLLFLEKGYTVLGIARNEAELKNLSTHPNFYYIKMDLMETEKIHPLLAQLPFKEVNILINNAGLLINKLFNNLAQEDFIKSFKVNFLAPVQIIQSLSEKFTKNSHIINISTIGAIQGSVKFPTLSAYGGSKAALCNLTEILAEEWKDRNIAINCLALGAVQTEMLHQAFPDYKAPLNAKEMAKYIVDFALNGNTYYNGKVLPVSLSTP